MKKITNFIVDARYFILGLFIVLAIFCGYLSTKVKINYDITKYLPSTSETRIGMDIMEDEFEDKTSSFNIMFEGLKNKEKQKIYEELSNIKDVSSVEYDTSKDYNKEDYTLYVVNVDDKDDSKTSKDVYTTIKEKYSDYKIITSGPIAEKNEPVLHEWIIIFAVVCALIILMIMCESYFEPFLYLAAILIGVVFNYGTNIMFNSVSNITQAISAILQMALSMDYSIMLMDRYRQEKSKENDKVKAMKIALYNSFKSISSSSVTTIVGLIVLVFMSFTIGRDLGFVLAKGVLFSLVSIFFCLPALVLLFDNIVTKTHKKVIKIKMDTLGSISHKCRYASLIVFIILFLVSLLLKGNLKILYTGSQNDKVTEIFTEENQMAIIYENKYEEQISEYCRSLEGKKNVKKILCYGNTIDQDLKYNELNDKLSDLGADVKIDEYLLKILYYNYYNKNDNMKLSMNEFINFIENDVYNNENISEKIEQNTKNNIKRLKYFSTAEELDKIRSKSELANILEIDENVLDKLLIYYDSKNNDVRLSLRQFIIFMKQDILQNEEYSKNISDSQINSLNKLLEFTNKDMLNDSYDYKQMSKIFGIDEDKVSDIYLYYILNNDVELKLTLNDFSKFIIDNLLSNKKYNSNFDEKSKESIKTLSTFSDKDFVIKQMDNKTLKPIFSLNDETINKLKLLKYMNQDNGTKLTISSLLDSVMYVKTNTELLKDQDLSSIETLYNFKNNQYIESSISKEQLYNFFDKKLVDNIYTYSSFEDDKAISPHEFVNIIVNNYSDKLDKDIVNKFVLLKNVLENNNEYTATNMSNILPIDNTKIYNLYALIDYASNNTSTWSLSPYELVSLIIKSNAKLDDKTNEKITLLNTVMDSTINNKTYTYQELSKIVGMDEEKTKSIYSIYILNQNITKLTPKSFVSFVLNTPYIKQNMSDNQISSLNLLSNVITDTLNNKTYSSLEISNLLGLSKDNTNLIYGLYKHKNSSSSKSLRTLISFIINNVINDEKYASNFSESSKTKIYAINDIMMQTLDNRKYDSTSLYTSLSKLNNSIDKNMIKLVYIYYGSTNNYDESWSMTVEKLVNYINNDILNDNTYKEYIKDDMRKKIIDSKTTISDAKKQLVGKNHSRVVIKTRLEPESKETFKFIEDIKKNLKEKTNDTAYIIGDSPMAYEMSKSFNQELDFITVLTMIFIFVVVALTFKSIIIPLMLVLIIQCSVYTTMGVLSIQGDPVYFISVIIVQSILMGATIDYAIVYTSYYLEHRKSFNIKESIISSYNKSINTIITSSSILIIVTLIVGNFASAIAAKICKTISIGTLCSTILILLLLPGILATFDKIITRKLKN